MIKMKAKLIKEEWNRGRQYQKYYEMFFRFHTCILPPQFFENSHQPTLFILFYIIYIIYEYL